MKSTLPIAFFSLLLFATFYSCEKDLPLNNPQFLPQNGITESVFELAKLIDAKLKNQDFRAFLFDRISTKFDGDYNVLIQDLLDQQPLLKNDFKRLDIEFDPLLQISIPKNISKLSGIFKIRP